jgi:hypothetical protein
VKFQKLDQKQTPQVVALVILVIGVFGWAGYSAISSAAPPKKKPTQTSRVNETVQLAKAPDSVVGNSATGVPGSPADAANTAAGVAAAEGAAIAGGPVPSPIPGGAPLPSIYSPDPFRSLVPAQPKTGRTKSASTPESRPSTNRRTALNKLFGLPGVEGAFPGLNGDADVRPAPPAPPVRPELELTGVIDAEKGGTDMALVVIDDQQRILQVGDMLSNNYRVKKIGLDGVLLVCGKDRFFVAVGKKTEPAQSKSEDGAAVIAPILRS